MKKKIGIFLVLIAIIVISVTTYSYLANKDSKNTINQNDEEEISLKSEELKDLLKYIQNDKIYKYDSDYLINIYYSNQKQILTKCQITIKLTLQLQCII